ncbi:hypothetical protein ACHAXA_010618 [Cyclostephanos tholiformis]|uniref:Uncharacterized protein n=1 Tax=Cyclostephanos tholiformis TaxID=382380 RepID=A0ABD3R7W9_9STRA
MQSKGCACQTADDVGYLFGCGTRPEDEEMVVRRRRGKGGEKASNNGGEERPGGGGGGRQRRLAPPPAIGHDDYYNAPIEVEYDSVGAAHRFDPIAHRTHEEYDEMVSKLLSPRPRRDVASSFINDRSPWSISNVLDYVQLRGGCHQEPRTTNTGGGERRRSRYKARRPAVAGCKSDEDGGSTTSFRKMTMKVAELKSQLKSMRRERNNMGRTIPPEETRQDEGSSSSGHRRTSTEDRLGAAGSPAVSAYDLAIDHARETLQWEMEQRRKRDDSVRIASGSTSPLSAAFTVNRPVPGTSMTNNLINPPGTTGVTMNNLVDRSHAANVVRTVLNSYGMNTGASLDNAMGGEMTGSCPIPTYTMQSGPALYQQMPQQQTPFPQMHQQHAHQLHTSQQQAPENVMMNMQIHQHVPQHQQPQQPKIQPKYEQPMTNIYNGDNAFSVAPSDVRTHAHSWKSSESNYHPSKASSRPSPVDPSPSSKPSTSGPSISVHSNDDEFHQSNRILNELRIKNELIQRDIERIKMDVATCDDGSGFLPTGGGGMAQSRQHPTASCVSLKEKMEEAMKRSNNAIERTSGNFNVPNVLSRDRSLHQNRHQNNN